ncbi:MAG TPA: DUF1641 domain-containing protein [Bacillota bacterium]|nr:DUF1641 domain-containing protein [Bacillota bacterium]
MAEPVRHIKRMEIPEEDIQSESIDEVLAVISENKESVVKGVNLLAHLDEAGMLDTLSALTIQRKVAMEKMVNELIKERYQGSLENLMPLFTMLGTLNIDELSFFIERINRGMKDAIENDTFEKTSYMNVLTALKDPDINRSVTLLLQFLKGMGRES